ncbi:helix-turn-helix domain-containing protein [Allonocardiopsis opalescens]|uniref:Cytoskeletal protein RodZ n=1 Tax=Allonocardiopsis opalescens TaxID=1144618 RepID=A0A2T0QFC7_9ACTN|nr:RodZ domain-containing protein [Allonocardiopsis opalescens]PRY02629.1 cytoskeletal protein RodZ [Allonocardiopsis opalescens]
MSIGEQLAQARREANLSIRYVAERTRIRETVIHAIERDDFSLCGGDFYARGHIRSLAKLFGLDPVPLVAEFDAEFGPAPSFDTIITPDPVLSSRRRVSVSTRRRPNWTMAMALALLGVVGYGVFYAVTAPAPQGPATAQRVVAESLTGPQEREPSESAPQAEPSPSPSAQRLRLELRAEETTWVSVKDAEGQELFSGTIEQGSSRDWSADHDLRVVVGNAGGLTMLVNGEDLGPVGESGEVEAFTVRPDDPPTAALAPS